MRVVDIMVILIFMCGFSGLAGIDNEKNKRELDKIKHDKVVEIIWKKYAWKSERLRVYTDLVYRND